MLMGLTSFGRFTLHAPLSCGGMGQTWLAHDTRAFSERPQAVVLKTIRADLADDDEIRASFRREMELTARVALHPGHLGLVRHIDHGTWEGVDFLAVEHIEGASVADLPASALPPAAVLSIGRDVAHALAYVHGLRTSDGAPLGLVHSDVSPQNILIDRSGSAVLIDFGAAALACDFDGDDDVHAHVIGKPGYLSPEQSRGKRVDGRSDQYSLGVVLWELLAGRSLFEGSARRKNVHIPSLTAFGCVGGEVDDVIRRMLSLNPADRYADCLDCADALTRVLHGDAAGVRGWLGDRVARAEPSATARTLRSYKTRPSV